MRRPFGALMDKFDGVDTAVSDSSRFKEDTPESRKWRMPVLLVPGSLKTTDRLAQEIDSVEYGMTDIQEYYANTGALKKPAENRKQVDSKTGRRRRRRR